MKEIATFYVAGVQHHQASDVPNLDAGLKVTLEPEPGNPFDKNAIKLLIDNIQIGYVPKKWTGIIHAYLNERIPLEAEVSVWNPEAEIYRCLQVTIRAESHPKRG